jgi:hypothetical protein
VAMQGHNCGRGRVIGCSRCRIVRWVQQALRTAPLPVALDCFISIGGSARCGSGGWVVTFYPPPPFPFKLCWDPASPNGLVPFEPQRALPCPASPFLLVHLPKCAGTSMRAAVSRILFKAKVPRIQQCIPGQSGHTRVL